MSESQPAQNLDMDGVIRYLADLLTQQFGDAISFVYYGDVGIYPPRVFTNDLNQPVKAVLAISPRFDRLDREHSSAAYEIRQLGINVQVIVNIIPFFEAMPEQAFGERALVLLVGRIRTFLAQNELLTLYGRVMSARVTDVDWNYSDRGTRDRDQMTREATLLLETTVAVRTM